MGRLRQVPGRLGRVEARVKPVPKVAASFYVSPEWRKLVAQIKRERGPWCEVCGAGGRGVRVIGDHTVEIKDGGERLDPGNVKLMCAACHNAKTARVKAARAVGRVGGGQKSGGRAAR